MLNLNRLEAATTALEGLAGDIHGGVVNLNAQLAALRAEIDPTAQARADALADRAEAVVAELTATKALTQEIPPPPVTP